MTGSDDAVPLPSTGPLLAVDVGERRIGLALSDPEQRLAHPLATLTRRPGRRFPLRALRPHLDDAGAVGVVVGLPLTLEGDEGPSALEARRIGQLIGDTVSLPVAYEDERFTTARAHGAIRDLEGSTRGRKGDVDQLAATVLLQQYLDRRR
jgi:putative Holliday junction resolvase